MDRREDWGWIRSTYAGTKVPGLAGYPANFYLGRSVVFRVVSLPPHGGESASTAEENLPFLVVLALVRLRRRTSPDG